MWFHINPSGAVPIYVQIIDQVKKAAATGLLKAGDQLPSVRELAVQLTVNPNTIAKAYHELEREGVIKTERGRGTFISEKGSKILPEEKQKVLGDAIDKVLVEAHHLRFSREEILELFIEKLEEWSNKLNKS